MTDERKISLCFTNYNRDETLLDAFEKVYDDERISEIIVSDDHSEKEYYETLQTYFEYFPKVKMFRNEINLDCYKNKRQAVELASNDWVCLWDSDNIFGKDYIDKLYEKPEWKANTIYTPSFAAPHFDFRPYDNLIITKENVSQYIDKPLFETCLNAANYFVNRDQYLDVWDGSIDPVTSDSIYMCYNRN